MAAPNRAIFSVERKKATEKLESREQRTVKKKITKLNEIGRNPPINERRFNSKFRKKY